MYKFISGISLFVRMFLLPNPFESLSYGVIINFLIEPLLYKLTYFIVGLFYDSGLAPAVGSLLYIFFYTIHIGLLMLWGLFELSKLSFVLIAIVYIAVLFFITRMFTSRYKV